MIRGPIADGWNWVDAGEARGTILVAGETCDEGRKHRLVAVMIWVLEYAF
jgi:hypothetical protein